MADRMLRLWVEECGLVQALTAAGLFPPRASTVTMAYRSPGVLTGYVSPMGDLFSLASVAYECLVGTPAFKGADDESVAAVIQGNTRPSVMAERTDLPSEVDTVLHRAWSDEPVYGTAGAFARDLSRVLLTNPATRGSAPLVAKPRMPVVTGARERQIPHRPANSNKTTLLGLAPGVGNDRLPAHEENPVKSTLLGVGVGAVPRGGTRPAAPVRPANPLLQPPSAPMDKPPGTVDAPLLASSIQASTPSDVPTMSPLTDTEQRPRVRRPTETTQRVEVPRIRPPGTEPIESFPTRVKVPLSTGRTIAGTVHPDEERSVTESGEQPVSRERLSDRTWGEIEASLGVLDADSLETVATVVDSPLSPLEAPATALSPASTSPEPPAPTTSSNAEAAAPSPTASMFDLSAEVFDPVLPTKQDAPAASGPVAGHEDSIAIDPDLGPPPLTLSPEPSIPIVTPPTPIAPAINTTPPPMPSSMSLSGPTASASPAAGTARPPLAAQSWPSSTESPPQQRPVVPPWAPLMSPPSETTARIDLPSKRRRLRVALGSFLAILFAGGAAAAWWITLKQDRPADLPASVNPPRAPRLVGGLRDAGRAANTSNVVGTRTGPSPASLVATTDASLVATTDASLVATTDASLVATTDASTTVTTGTSASLLPPSVERPERRHSHPRAREVNAFIEALTPEVRRCVAASTRHRRVRIGVVWEGRTGRATEVHVGSAYAAPPVGPCLEEAVRARPITPFTDRDFETSLTFDPR
jgi:hypothetical protein